jgi:hypothetical protein
MTEGVDPLAPTQYASPERSHTLNGCALAHETHAMLVGDHREQGVFERLRRIERLLGMSLLIIAGPLWWMAWMMHAQAGLGQ